MNARRASRILSVDCSEVMHFDHTQWILGSVAAMLVGVSKTGLPGTGILVVPLLAAAFGSRPSVGIMLPMLIFADLFAVTWYRRHAQWDKLVGLIPWVVAGMASGAVALWAVGEAKSQLDILGKAIGVIVLVMLFLTIVQDRLDERLTPHSPAGVAFTGAAAGFTTMVSNAAGPVMTIYMTAHKLPKKQFVGTLAWYFFIFNLSKLPIYAVLTALNPAKPMMTAHSLLFNLMVCPVILLGVFAGKWLLPRIPQKLFDTTVLALAGIAAVKLVVG